MGQLSYRDIRRTNQPAGSSGKVNMSQRRKVLMCVRYGGDGNHRAEDREREPRVLVSSGAGFL